MTRKCGRQGEGVKRVEGRGGLEEGYRMEREVQGIAIRETQ